MSANPRLTLTELEAVDALPGISGPPHARFVQHVVRWVLEWQRKNRDALAAGTVPPGNVAIFVLSESPRLHADLPPGLEQVAATRVRSNALDQNTTGLLLCTENLADICRRATGIESVDEALDLAETLPADATFVIVPLVQRRVLVHFPGCTVATWTDAPVEWEVDVREQTDATPANVERLIEEFATDKLRLPQGCVAARVWKGGKPFDLEPYPENLVQINLLSFLQGYFRRAVVFVDEEVKVVGGRADIRVARAALPGSAYRTVTTFFELKILKKSLGVAGNLTWARKGITQAHSYRIANTDATYAWLFDARQKKKDLMPQLIIDAQAKGVELRLSPMHANAED